MFFSYVVQVMDALLVAVAQLLEVVACVFLPSKSCVFCLRTAMMDASLLQVADLLVGCILLQVAEICNSLCFVFSYGSC